MIYLNDHAVPSHKKSLSVPYAKLVLGPGDVKKIVLAIAGLRSKSDCRYQSKEISFVRIAPPPVPAPRDGPPAKSYGCCLALSFFFFFFFALFDGFAGVCWVVVVCVAVRSGIIDLV